MTHVIFSDLDGTLLDRTTYAWDAAKAALTFIRERSIPLILVTSKTRAEVEHWREVLGNTHPFVVENGAAAFVPTGYFASSVPGTSKLDAYEMVRWGRPYAALIRCLKQASHSSRCRVRGFHEMTDEEVATACDLPIDQARLAKRREFDEPFEVLDSERVGELTAAIAAQGLRCEHGGRFYHISGMHEKGLAAIYLSRLFRREHADLVTIGLGDSRSDIPLLRAVDIPIAVRSPHLHAIVQQLPRARTSTRDGPAGWAESILEVLKNQDKSA